MNELTRIYKDHNVRIIEKDAEPWFVAKDVAEILGYSDTQAMTRKLAKDEKQKVKSDEMSVLNNRFGNNDITIINEYGLFAAILKSNKKEAIDFQRWITHEVLPSIRRTGSYSPSGQEKEGKLDKNIEDAIAARDKLIASKKESDEQYKQDLERFNNLIDREEVKALLPKMPHTLVVEILNLARLKYGLYVKTQKNPELPGGEA